MENVSTRTLTHNPTAEWFSAAGGFVGRVWSAVRAFRGALRKEPARAQAEGRLRAVPAPRSSWSEQGELPESYGRTKVVAMVVSPYLVHVYWDLAPKDGPTAGPGRLRFEDAGGDASFDVAMELSAKNWYVHLWSPDKRYTVELAAGRGDGAVPLARSNPIQTPRAWPVASVAPAPVPVNRDAADVSAPSLLPRSQAPAKPVVAARTPQEPAARMPPAPVVAGASRETQVPESGGLRVSPPTVPAFVPMPAGERVREQLGKLYASRRWQLRDPATGGFVAPEEGPPVHGPAAAVDLTARSEYRFVPGVSSILLAEADSDRLAP